MVQLNYSETLTGNLTLNTSNAVLMFMGPATITMGSNRIPVSAGVAGAFIVGQPPNGALAFNGTDYNPGGVQFVYTGNAAAISAGGSTPISARRVENFAVDISGAGSSAIAIDIIVATGKQPQSFIRIVEQ